MTGSRPVTWGMPTITSRPPVDGRPRDRRAVRHAAPDGTPDACLLAKRPHAVVVGGGIAGLAAATGLAERGVQVTLLERDPQLGGRVAGWTEPGGPETGGRETGGRETGGTETGAEGGLPMSRGFHAFFRQYYNLRALLRRTDPALSRLAPLTDYPLIDASGNRDSFRGLPRTPPLNAAAFAWRSPTFSLRDLLALDPLAAAPLLAVSVPEIYRQLDEVDAETFLRRINFPPAARHLAFDVFSRSFFAPPDQMSAAELAVMFHIYFLGSSEGLLFDVPSSGFDQALWEPLQAYLAALGADIRTGTAVTCVEPHGSGFRVRDTSGGVLDADGVVLAADVQGLRAIVAASPGLADPEWRARVAGLRTAPPFLVHRLWLDRPVAADRPPFLAVGGCPPLDNISVLNRYDSQARAWAVRRGGSVVELHAYAASGDQTRTREEARTRMYELYPETRAARIVAESVLWRADCPLFGLGDFARRPRVRTPFGGLVLAGDGIRIDVPVALMERAATTGWHAANCLLARWGLVGHDLYTVPVRGRGGPLSWLAAQASRQTSRQTHDPRRDPGHASREDHNPRRDPGHDSRQDSGQDSQRDFGQDPRQDHDPRRDSGRDSRRDSGQEPRQDSGHDPRRDFGHDFGQDSRWDFRQDSGQPSRQESQQDLRQDSTDSSRNSRPDERELR